MPTAKQIAARKAFGERSKAAAEARRAEKLTPTPDTVISDTDTAYLLQKIKELEQQMYFNKMSGQQYNVGIIEKYVTDPAAYPDPCERLAEEDKLKRFAFKENYELKFDVSTTTYETKDGRNISEPRFKLDLIGKVFDDNGLPTNKRYVITSLLFHEDPQAAIVIANNNGIDINSQDKPTFLNEMRYLTMRDWLLEAFYPPTIDVTNKNRQETVIGNRLVTVYETSSKTPQAIPFNEMK